MKLIFKLIIYLQNLNFDAYDEEINGKMTSFVVLSDPRNLSNLLQFLYDKEIKFTYTDLSNDVLEGNISFSGTTIEKSVLFYIEDHLTQDHVLDKINKSGIDSLNDFERSLLENS